MLHVYNKTCIGYAHAREKKTCQDYSASFRDNDRLIITCCDGHGGDLYVRSRLGSHFASNALISTLTSFDKSILRSYPEKEIEDQIRMQVLCEWNRQVEESISKFKLRASETKKLKEEQKEILMKYPAKAYGTTLSGAVLIGKKLIVVSIGDGECLLLKKGEMEKVFNTDDDPAGNITYSMCQEDAYKYIRVRILDFSSYDGILLCTDGLSSPYQSYQNLKESMIDRLMLEMIEGNGMNYASTLVSELATSKGVGDDVSLAFIIDDEAKQKNYR